MTDFGTSLASGAVAGTAVDLLFYPLDTVKTRLQSNQGFIASGGFKGVYRGLGSVVVGSAPGAALFFTTYEKLKSVIPKHGLVTSDPVTHMLSASGGEIAACLVRVPTEVVKQRQQTSAYGSTTSSLTAFRRVIADGGIRELYRGFGTTIAREIPFCMIQFPLYEHLKSTLARRLDLASPASLPSPYAAGCGSVAGSVAAALTTPLDVAKTRTMLRRSSPAPSPSPTPPAPSPSASPSSPSSIRSRSPGLLGTLVQIVREEGPTALFKGLVPRTIWIGLGGAVFLGAYEATRMRIQTLV